MIEILKKCGIDIDELSEEDQLIVTNALINAWKERLAKQDPDEVRESMIAALLWLKSLRPQIELML